ncbi:MAG: hypothetical protein PVS3B1_24650 [Ktedonobacteraceae bacterium]
MIDERWQNASIESSELGDLLLGQAFHPSIGGMGGEWHVSLGDPGAQRFGVNG